MHLSTLLLSLTAAASTTTAYIYAISAPSTIAANASFPLTLHSRVQNSKTVDVAVAYGFTTPPGNRGSIGQNFGTIYTANKGQETFTVDVQAPEDLADYTKNGKVQVGAGVFQMLGGVGNVRLVAFNVTVGVGEEVGGALVTSEGAVDY